MPEREHRPMRQPEQPTNGTGRGPERGHSPAAEGSGQAEASNPANASSPAVVVWVVPGTWQATVDAARWLATAGAHITLLHVAADDIPQAGHGAYAGLLGRGRPGRDPGTRMEQLAASSATEILDAAAGRLAVPCTRAERHGRVEREVIAACEDADLLILARNGDRTRLGPRSLGKATRFVLDHAPCQVLLVWPEAAPRTSTIPPPPPGPPGHEPPGHSPHGHEPPGHRSDGGEPHGHEPHGHEPHGHWPAGDDRPGGAGEGGHEQSEAPLTEMPSNGLAFTEVWAEAHELCGLSTSSAASRRKST